ncbi:uncharacterized protein NPIL_285151 [Nephila pilipes]|uniref:CCHC-type domain-containing protein n=1 Tax=Nephila pilipes TaxID=299642 RepID=A0A8X6R490_NEPPI|nr:uncharacterized protein NPIL_285151 [Nephila pilipes]
MLEAFDNILRSLPSGPRRHMKESGTLSGGNQVTSRKAECLPNRKQFHAIPNERSPSKCYGCGRQGMIKSTCPTSNPNSSCRTDVATNHVNAYVPKTRSTRVTLMDINFSGKKGRESVDTGSSHSIAEERYTMYHG